jgi:membrane-associated phospholipid phosphatase
VGLDRIYAGTHWPSDVLAGVLIATAWLSFVLSIRWIRDRDSSLSPSGERARERGEEHKPAITAS